MRNILSDIVEQKRSIVDAAKKIFPLEKIRAELEVGHFRMSQAIRKGRWSLIAECKLQSPAKGRLNSTHSVVELARIYEANGAKMLSVHTDPHFLGSNEDFSRVRQTVGLPLLRKDFIIDEYQIYEARRLGADAILLIVRILTADQLRRFEYLAWTLGMDCLVEVHDEADLTLALETRAEFIGINNRNLKTFTTSIDQTLELMPKVDRSRTIISESGVNSLDDIKKLRAAGVDGVLVGEGLVRAADIGAQTKSFSVVPRDS